MFALGLTFGFVRREDVVRWADRRIMEIESPPAWLIDLSLSRDWNPLDAISSLEKVGKGSEVDSIFKTVLGLIPEITDIPFDAAEALSKQLYDIASHCIDDWHNPLLIEADQIKENFVLQPDGYCTLSQQEVVNELVKFVVENRDQRIVDALHPVAWVAPVSTRSQTGDEYDRQSLTRVGVAAWIILDGNYADFAVGQTAKFALEFYPPHGLKRTQAGPPVAQHLRASHYHVRAQVAFAGENVWVINAGSFMAFYEQKPPDYMSVGAWVEGEIYLGIDPFSCFGYAHSMDRMPQLAYSWIVREIARETTPLIEARDEVGRPYRTRDESREAFKPTRQTNARRDDGGNAHYVLGCQRIEGPGRP